MVGQSRIEWFSEQLKTFLRKTGRSYTHIRRLHYYIVTLPEHEKTMPSDNPAHPPRPYENTIADHNVLIQALKEARLQKLISPNKIIDLKSPPYVQGIYDRTKADFTNITFNASPGNYIEVQAYKMNKWDRFIKNIDINYDIQPEKHYNQFYRIVVVIEKSTAESELEFLCKLYGADLIVYAGNPTVTREFEACKLAQEENKPLLILYISDLDPAGLNMPKAFYKNVMRIYPHPYHKCGRIGLYRSQAEKLNLPPSFDIETKDYSENAERVFIRETGSNVCIELDAVDEDILAEWTEKTLKMFCGHKKDIEHTDNFSMKADEFVNELLQSYDYEQYKKEYEKNYNQYQEVLKKVQEFKKTIFREYNEINYNLYEIQRKIKEDLKNAMDTFEV